MNKTFLVTYKARQLFLSSFSPSLEWKTQTNFASPIEVLMLHLGFFFKKHVLGHFYIRVY